jgi:hypothetical protein
MKIFILIVLTLFSACRSYQVTRPLIDPWHGTFIHQSGKSTMVLNHFDKEAVAIDILEDSQARPQGFFANIKGNIATFKDRTDSKCKLIFQAVNEGIIFTDQCHGTGESDGLYKRTVGSRP